MDFDFGVNTFALRLEYHGKDRRQEIIGRVEIRMNDVTLLEHFPLSVGERRSPDTGFMNKVSVS